MTPLLDIFVAGFPAPGGSKRVFVSKKTGKFIVTDDAKNNKSWREVVAGEARRAWDGKPLLGMVPLWLDLTFCFLHPKSHYRNGRHAAELRATAPAFPVGRPDAIKLARAAEDALTGIVWRDDSAIVEERVRKVYSDKPGMWLRVGALPMPPLDRFGEHESSPQLTFSFEAGNATAC